MVPTTDAAAQTCNWPPMQHVVNQHFELIVLPCNELPLMDGPFTRLHFHVFTQVYSTLTLCVLTSLCPASGSTHPPASDDCRTAHTVPVSSFENDMVFFGPSLFLLSARFSAGLGVFGGMTCSQALARPKGLAEPSYADKGPLFST